MVEFLSYYEMWYKMKSLNVKEFENGAERPLMSPYLVELGAIETSKSQIFQELCKNTCNLPK